MLANIDNKLYYDIANHIENINTTENSIKYNFKIKSEKYVSEKLRKMNTPSSLLYPLHVSRNFQHICNTVLI